MANTYTQCYFHLVFAVKNRDALVRKEWKNEMEMYITGIIQNHQLQITCNSGIENGIIFICHYIDKSFHLLQSRNTFNITFNCTFHWNID